MYDMSGFHSHHVVLRYSDQATLTEESYMTTERFRPDWHEILWPLILRFDAHDSICMFASDMWGKVLFDHFGLRAASVPFLSRQGLFVS